MRWLALLFVALIAALQYPMWLGKGGWLQVRSLDAEVAAQRAVNQKLRERNESLDADVRDLKTGFDAIEERARAGLGMIRQDEIFFEFAQPPAQKAAPAAPGTDEAAPNSSRPITEPRAIPGEKR